MAKFRILFIDDELDNCEGMQEYLEEQSGKLYDDTEISIEFDIDFNNAMTLLDERRYDLIILDVRVGALGHQGHDAGKWLLEEIKKVRFIPVIFYTKLPRLVDDLNSPPLIQVFTRAVNPHHDGIINGINNVLMSPLHKINQALNDQVAIVQRDYMWDFIAQHWNEVNKVEGDHSLFYLIARRLAISLSSFNIDEIIITRKTTTSNEDSTSVPPERYYIMPPIGKSSLAGDIYKPLIGDEIDFNVRSNAPNDTYWVILTPSCDLVERLQKDSSATPKSKAEKVLLAKCKFITEFTEYKKWSENTDKNKEILKLLQNRSAPEDRYFYLPGALDLPNLVVDFQETITLDFSELNNWERKASLDSPFAEALLSRFMRYFGRLGTPDLNTDLVLSRLKNNAKSSN